MRTTTTIAVGSFVAAALLAAAPAARAQDQEEGFTIEADVGIEYDDNLTLASDTLLDPAIDDTIFRLKPRISWYREQRDNRFTLGADADWRKGFDTDLDEFNVGVDGSADFRHPSGAQVRIYDRFTRRGFDQALSFIDLNLQIAEPGVAEALSNTLGVDVAYRPRERFMVGGGYEFRYEDFDFGDLGGDDQRQRHWVKGRVEVPVSDEFTAYGDASYMLQESDQRVEFDFDDQRYVGGIMWESPGEVTFFAEGGWQGVDYDDIDGREFDEGVVRAGFEAPLTEQSSVSGWAGRNAYEDFTAGGEFTHRTDDQRVKLSLRRDTENSFSQQFLGRIYEATVLSGSFDKTLDRWNAGVEAGWFRQDFEGLGGIQNDTVSLTARLMYRFHDNIGVGARYRFAQRTSDDPVQEFDNNRVYFFVRLIQELY